MFPAAPAPGQPISRRRKMKERQDFTLSRRTSDFRKAHAVDISGIGDRTVVLGNGFGTDKSFWRELTPWLEQRFRVVRFDW